MIKNFLIEEGDAITPQMEKLLPALFTNPFSYTPHPLCVEASKDVCSYIRSNLQLKDEIDANGKMFGVLVAKSPYGKLGYLAAFSGVLGNGQHNNFFVPPVYDLLSPQSFFPQAQSEISSLNAQIAEMENNLHTFGAVMKYNAAKKEFLNEIGHLKDIYAQGKRERAERRLLLENLPPEEYDAARKAAELESMMQESRFRKGEIRRATKRMQQQLQLLEMEILEESREINRLKSLRKEKSALLQQKIFSHFSFCNALGESRLLPQLFAGSVPPAGAGECAAPRLLQYAYLNNYRPIAMGEFWVGGNGSSQQRHSGVFYPSCKEKCAPILAFMLKGLDVEPANFHSGYGCDAVTEGFLPQILYSDKYLIAVNKPAGILSAPGKDNRETDILQLLYRSGSVPEISSLHVVHRLDMHTSGIMLIALSQPVYKGLQRQFHCREVIKKYIAVLDGNVAPGTTGKCVVWDSCNEGTISIPLLADYRNRPMQMVDLQNGKEAITKFRITKREGNRTYIEFYPLTGRTHQLRVHAAHELGLDAPIVGDPLYGTPSKRLMLHAQQIKFTHPQKGEITIGAEPYWWPLI